MDTKSVVIKIYSLINLINIFKLYLNNNFLSDKLCF